jgi:hypothetical protein
MGGQQPHLVAEALENPTPVVGGPAGFHQHHGWWRLGEKLHHLFTIETLALEDPSVSPRCNLENVLG